LKVKFYPLVTTVNQSMNQQVLDKPDE